MFCNRNTVNADLVDCLDSWSRVALSSGTISTNAMGPLVYYVSTFFYQPQYFHEFFEHSLSCTKHVKFQHENFVKM